jgi:predicted tellurium resistance membrane protein TerC
MLLAIMLESIMFGLLGMAILRVSRLMNGSDYRTAIVRLLSTVLVLLGLKLGWDLIIDGRHAIDSGTFSAALAGVVIVSGGALGIASIFVMLNANFETSRDTNG